MVERHELVTRSDYDDGASERTSDEIRQDIAARRESITETVDKLNEHVHRTLDWRVYVAEHPMVVLGVAAGLGFLTAGIFKPRLSPRERILAALSETVEDVTGRLRDQIDQLPLQSAKSSQSVKAVAAAMATKVITDYLHNRILGTNGTGRNSTEFATHSAPSSVHSPSGFE